MLKWVTTNFLRAIDFCYRGMKAYCTHIQYLTLANEEPNYRDNFKLHKEPRY